MMEQHYPETLLDFSGKSEPATCCTKLQGVQFSNTVNEKI